MKGTYLLLDAKYAQSVPNGIRKIFSSVLPKQLTKINQCFLCYTLGEQIDNRKA